MNQVYKYFTHSLSLSLTLPLCLSLNIYIYIYIYIYIGESFSIDFFTFYIFNRLF